MLEDFRRHAPELTAIARHAGPEHPFDLCVAIFRKVAAQIGRVALIEGAALELFTMTAATAQRPADPLAMGNKRRGPYDLSTVERDWRDLWRRLARLLLAPGKQQRGKHPMSHQQSPGWGT